MISEQDKENIRKQARSVLDKFARELDKVNDFKVSDEDYGNGFREEGNSVDSSKDFRNRMFANAKKHDNDCIVAEKKW